MGLFLWQSFDLGVLLLSQSIRVWTWVLAATEALKALEVISGVLGLPRGPATTPSLSRADGSSSLSQDLIACSSTLTGITWTQGSNSPSPKKEQKEYLITGGCCQPTVSEVLGRVLLVHWESWEAPPSCLQPQPRALLPLLQNEYPGPASQMSLLLCQECASFSRAVSSWFPSEAV